LRTPRDYTGLRNPSANAPASPKTDQTKAAAAPPIPEPTRPERVRAPSGWPQDQRIDAQQGKAAEYSTWANEQANKAHAAQSAKQAPGKAAVRADIEKARGNQPAQGQAREQAPVPGPAPEAARQQTGKAAVRADIQKARDSQPTQQAQQPSKDSGRSGGDR